MGWLFNDEATNSIDEIELIYEDYEILRVSTQPNISINIRNKNSGRSGQLSQHWASIKVKKGSKTIEVEAPMDSDGPIVVLIGDLKTNDIKDMIVVGVAFMRHNMNDILTLYNCNDVEFRKCLPILKTKIVNIDYSKFNYNKYGVSKRRYIVQKTHN